MLNVVPVRIKSPIIVKKAQPTPKITILQPKNTIQKIPTAKPLVEERPPKQQKLIPPPTSKIIGNAVAKNRFVKPTISRGPKTESTKISDESYNKIKALAKRGYGRILAIIANGPSINEIELEKLEHHNIDIMSVNKPHPKLWPTEYWIFCDSSQYVRHKDLWESYNSGFIINSAAIKIQKRNSTQVYNLGNGGFSRDMLKGIYISNSTVMAAMQVSYWMEFTHTYILGCDMDQNNNGPTHFYGNNPDVLPEVRKKRFSKEAEFYDKIADTLSESERKKYTFCSSYNNWPFVNRYNKLDHKICIDEILNNANSL